MPLKENEYVTGRPMKTDSTGQQVAGSAYVLFWAILLCLGIPVLLWIGGQMNALGGAAR